MSMKNPLTPAGIEPETFRFVTQHLNHCATAVGLTKRLLKHTLETESKCHCIHINATAALY